MTFFSTAAKTSSIQDAQSSLASENDRRRYKGSVDKLQRDVMEFLSRVYERLTRLDAVVTVPTQVHLTIDEVMKLYGMDLFEPQVAREFLANAACIHENHIKQGGPIVLHPIEYVEPKPPPR